MYMNIYIFALHLKLTQRGKLTIPQLKNSKQM